jgi:IclR family acetate operon transcriptional repressor
VELQEAFDKTVNVGILADGEVLYVDIMESAQGLRMAAAVGARHPVHSTALGKAILSALPGSEARELLTGYRRAALTPKTIVGLEALMDELAVTADRGYSIDDEEQELGVRCYAVSIPKAPAPMAVSVSGPLSRVDEAFGDRAVPVLRAIAERVGNELIG